MTVMFFFLTCEFIEAPSSKQKSCHRETDKQHICINTQLKKWFPQLKVKERKRLYVNKFY